MVAFDVVALIYSLNLGTFKEFNQKMVTNYLTN